MSFQITRHNLNEKNPKTPSESYFWATQGGAELDLLLFVDGKKIGFAFKYTDRPKLSSSMTVSCKDLNLSRLFVIIPGKITFPLEKNIDICGLEIVPETLKKQFYL